MAMQSHRKRKVLAALSVAVCLLILKVTVSVVSNFVDYLPPNFESDFLLGRDAYFYGVYQWAFYTHIASGPVTLIFGMFLLSKRLRNRFSRWHRYVGRMQVILVLLMVTPSGLWMSMHAATGLVAGTGFGVLAVATGITAACGWRTAVRRKFAEHRRWMTRCYILLCSAVVLRLTVGLFIVTKIDGDWISPMTAWTSWLVPLLVYELLTAKKNRRTVGADLEPSATSG